MPVGAIVRRAFGRHERRVAELWRAMFLDLDDWVARLRDWAPDARHILELGCGEGYSTAKLAAAFPAARIDATDIADNLGRLYDGPADRVTFRRAYAEDLAAEQAGAYDLIVLTDVLHHVPAAARGSLLGAIGALLAPGGVLAFKDWERSRSPIYFAGYAADRWLTGDRIAYLTHAEACAGFRDIFGADCVTAQARIKPWRANYALRVQPT